MKTPICDFVNEYAERKSIRLHMPGHKGGTVIGPELLDITEISGADSLYEAQGIISESERYASSLFGCETRYSAEGSSLCVRAMLYLLTLYNKSKGRSNTILAGRNVHKSFVSAAALLDLDVQWLAGQGNGSYLSCPMDAPLLETYLQNAVELPTALYVTTPDYLGNMVAVDELAAVCHRYGVLLLVDNAHGAYLRFLQPSRHPMDLGADMCCDSAHKTLPVLTGGAYLHIAEQAPAMFSQQAKSAMALFGSTSPSYLILQSLDKVNAYLDDDYPTRLSETVCAVCRLKTSLEKRGYVLCGDEPLKLTLCPKSYGYTGKQLAQRLEERGIICEFSDPDYVVLMITPENSTTDLARLEAVLLDIPRLPTIEEMPPSLSKPMRELSIRQATLSVGETIPVTESVGRILATATVGCPPAVPIVVCGERIDETALSCFSYYGIEWCTVVKD